MSKRLSIVLFLFAVLAVAIVPVSAQEDNVINLAVTFGDTELAALEAALVPFEEATGIDVVPEPNREIVTIIRTRLAGGSPPDVMLVPQPGVVAEFARAGYLVPLVNEDGSDGLLSMDTLTENYGQGFIDLATVDGAIYGILAKGNSKSTIWYRPEQLEELGLEVPTTWEELMAAQQAMIDAGITPWSVGAGETNAWPITDWFENIYVRTAGPENYLKLFLTHEIPWTDPTVVEAFEHLGQIFHPADTNLAGGAEGTLATGFIEAANMVFDPEDPRAAMYYEGGFMGGIIAGNFPDLVPLEDFNAFMFPAINEEYGTPVVGGGDLLVAFTDRPEVRQFLEYMASPEGNAAWAAQNPGGIVSPNMNVGMDVYSPLTALDAGQVANAETFVFDGSDLMPQPAQVAFGATLQEFIADPESLPQLLEDLEAEAAMAYEAMAES